MRRLTLASIVSLYLIIPTSAHAGSTPSLSIFAGGNSTTVNHDNRTSRYGISGGGACNLEWKVSEWFAFAGLIELRYTPRGAETVVDGEYLGSTRAHYTDLILAARPGARFGSVSAYVVVGGGIDFLLSADKENASGAKQDITDGLHRVDVSLIGGAGAALHLPAKEVGPMHLGTVFLEGRYELGLRDTDVTGGFKNRTSSLMLGLSFVLGAAPSAPASSAATTAAR